MNIIDCTFMYVHLVQHGSQIPSVLIIKHLNMVMTVDVVQLVVIKITRCCVREILLLLHHAAAVDLLECKSSSSAAHELVSPGSVPHDPEFRSIAIADQSDKQNKLCK